ncbi:hypothetical protein D3C72_1479030 [compost metagenome]
MLEAGLRQLGKPGLHFGRDFVQLPRVGAGLVGGNRRQAVLHVEDLAQVPAGQQRLHALLAFVEGRLRGLQVQLGDPLEAGKQDAGVGEAVSEAAAVAGSGLIGREIGHAMVSLDPPGHGARRQVCW